MEDVGRLARPRPGSAQSLGVPSLGPGLRGLLRRNADSYLVPAAALALCASFLLSHAQAEDGPIVCPFRLATGLPCPGCGLTRSFVATAHGRWSDAFAYNLFGPLLFAAFIAYIGFGIAAFIRGRDFRFVEQLSLRQPAVAVTLGLWLAWAVVRMALTV